MKKLFVIAILLGVGVSVSGCATTNTMPYTQDVKVSFGPYNQKTITHQKAFVWSVVISKNNSDKVLEAVVVVDTPEGDSLTGSTRNANGIQMLKNLKLRRGQSLIIGRKPSNEMIYIIPYDITPIDLTPEMLQIILN